MEISYSSNENKNKHKKIEKNEKLNYILIKHDLISYSAFDKIIKRLLCDFCEIDICGYNTSENIYWGKQIKNNICILMFTLEMTNNYIKISPLIGNDNSIKELYINICDGLEIYNKSPFLFE
jgi:hypothetical protein